MCRILAHLGEPLPIRSLLFDTDPERRKEMLHNAALSCALAAQGYLG